MLRRVEILSVEVAGTTTVLQACIAVRNCGESSLPAPSGASVQLARPTF
jgi:hypothetical protein